ncbi:MAG: hypothetical protein FVQ83_08410 [Chloroflexi bacterium]|nr:hypothetical protein [Chloroflexota bacterium]
MNRKFSKTLTLMLALTAGFLVVSCSSTAGESGPVGPAGPAGPQGPAGPPGENASLGQSYVGSERCGNCHEAEYAKFILSGHPYKLNQVVDGEPPEYPYDSITGGLSDLPEGYEWSDISYVIGGYAWKARFINQDGYIITDVPGESGNAEYVNQYNFANEAVGNDAGWSSYHAGEEDKPYNCGGCHTTGYNPEGHQNDMEGIIGTWAAPGVQCEECHGPGSQHSEDPYAVLMVVDRSSQACGSCHVRSNPAEIDASGGFERHHEQYEDLYSSQHFTISCVTCHDPHASAVYADPNVNPDQGITQVCESCHWQNVVSNVEDHTPLVVTCVSCHMPPMVKSAVGNLDIFTADVRSHQFSINTDPFAPQFNEEGNLVMPYLTLPYVCQQCHNGQVYSEQSLEILAEFVEGYHDPTPPAESEE